jgi:hypothetical protein
MMDSKGGFTESEESDDETNVIHILYSDKRNNCQIFQSYFKTTKMSVFFKMTSRIECIEINWLKHYK